MKRKLLEQLTKSRNSLKRKFDELKQIKNKNVSNLEETFKPITEPLHELLTENKKLNKKEYINDTHETKFKKEKIRVPKSKKEKREHESDAYVDAFSRQSLIDDRMFHNSLTQMI